MNTHHPLDTRASDQIRGLIRSKLLQQMLREDVAHAAFGGVSAGSTCAACDRSISLGRPEIHTFGVDRLQRRYHPACHLLLSFELEDLAQR